ncbi:MAG: hypothetical protein KatS3mg085_373 [Candidatus Dojkabacteria bacterium]|nr:MAG: hypothetical protein KatS3mg085_373 [Candidatus Dojkabacteria bacterium]
MKIKRGKGGSVEFAGKKVVALAMWDDIEKALIVKVTYNEKEVIISSPGEYEYSGLGIVAIEATSDKYSGKINLARISVDGVSALFVPQDFSVSKEVKDLMGVCNILVVSNINPANLKTLVDNFNSEFVVIDAQNNLEEYSKVLKKQFGVDNLVSESVISLEEKDFDTEEDTPITFVQLA